MLLENEYRTHNCSEFGLDTIGKKVRAAGWVENIRDHGGVIFIDLRDHYGILQVVIHDEEQLKGVCRETVISVSGEIRKRSEETINSKIATGSVELVCDSLEVLGKCKHELPFEVPTSTSVKEELRLKYRFLDLRNSKVHKNIVIRSEMISFVRKKMTELGFLEIQTPILSASSPEGARDYLIPSRKHQGKFYALPQAPQIFKQLLMTSGFDKYFQIAPCFRDEDARADRSPGECYQLDCEMSFATQEDVFRVGEEVLTDVSGREERKRILYLLGVLFSPQIEYQKKRQILQKEFQIQMSKETESEMENMCNLSDGIYDRGVQQGKAEGKAEGKFESTVYHVKRIMEALHLPLEQALSVLGVPEEEQENYTRFML